VQIFFASFFFATFAFTLYRQERETAKFVQKYNVDRKLHKTGQNLP